MRRGGGHELDQAGQDSLLEQMEAPWVNTIDDIVRKNEAVHFAHPSPLPPTTKFCRQKPKPKKWNNFLGPQQLISESNFLKISQHF